MTKIDELEQLVERYKTGSITTEEFESMKANLLGLTDSNRNTEDDSKSSLTSFQTERKLSAYQTSFEALRLKMLNVETSLSDASSFLKKIYLNIIIQLIAAFIYFFILDFIVLYAAEVAKKDYQSSDSWFNWWFSQDNSGNSKIGWVKYLFEIVIFVSSVNILKALHGLSKSLDIGSGKHAKKG